ncbi:hypothetical protein EUGRSUZ_H04542 [Eucalyptus grandis]|uniref:Uncharacterized protein n=2 Tax=Eucalyptus grandis TaxID=71139 RepID=A0A059B6V7_EUCGR|nr:hypothetical protein EUGRSUZ_H04542 [Eucalyptus grandis]
MIPSRAMKRAAMSLSKLADTAHEELPSTTAAIRLSSMEIGVLTLDQDIADGIIKSAQALQAAEAGIRQIGSSSLPIILLQPVVAGATKSFISMICQGESSPESENESGVDRIEK